MSCLFDSLSTFVDINSTHLRRVIVEYLRSNPSLVENVSFHEMLSWDNIPHGDYLDTMSSTSTWGGAIEIQAFAQLFNIQVTVSVRGSSKPIEFVPTGRDVEPRLRTVCIHWTGNHFTPLKC